MVAQKLNKPVIKKLTEEKSMLSFKDYTWAAGSPQMGSLSSFYRGIKYLLCGIRVFTKYVYL